MLHRLFAFLGAAALALTINAGTASAQHHGGQAGGHAVGHVGGGHVVVGPHATVVRPGGAHFYGGRYGVGYRYPYYRPGFGVGIGLGYPYYYGNYGYGYGYPYDYGSAYPDYGAPYAPNYVPPDVIPPQASTSAYPPAVFAPAPAPSGSARLTVQLPAGAKLWIDGQSTQQTGALRMIETPPTLEPGRSYSYKLRAEWAEKGQPVERERDVSFQAGNQVVVNMNIP
jgi:uncharacterized protein (TIGR03000 family)